VFVPGKPFQPSLMFGGKAGAYPYGAPFSLWVRPGAYTRVDHLKGAYQQTLTSLDRVARDKAYYENL
jgi:hypothetical protein